MQGWESARSVSRSKVRRATLSRPYGNPAHFCTTERKGRPRPRTRCVPYFAHIKSDTISYINPELIQTPAAINIFRLDVYQLCSLSRHANRYIGRTYYHSHCTSVNTSAQIHVIAQGSLRSTIHRPLQLAHFQPMRLLHRFFHYLHAEDVMNIYI